MLFAKIQQVLCSGYMFVGQRRRIQAVNHRGVGCNNSSLRTANI